MTRAFLFVISFVMITCAMGTASATTATWCFNFGTSYTVDSEFDGGEDYLKPDAVDTNNTTVDASYLAVTMYLCPDAICSIPILPAIWSGHLNSEGCTTAIPVATGSYYFKYFALSHAESVVGDRRLFVMPDGGTLGYADQVDTAEAVFAQTVPAGGNVFDKQLTGFDADVKHLMGVGVTALDRYDYNGWDEDTDIWMSSDAIRCGGTFTEKHPGSENDYDVCISKGNLHKKFLIGHYVGDAFALMNDGLYGVFDYDGSEGSLRATGVGGRCDCDTMYVPPDSARSFCIGSREFTGAAQREGYASFESAVIMNARSSGGGSFMNNYRTMKWSSTHGDTLPFLFWGDPYWEPPFRVDLDDDANVKWMEYECNPSGSFTHFATEWDWMDFFWNLWTEGGTSNRYSVTTINAIWGGVYVYGEPSVMEAASLCCTTDGSGNPSSCVARNLDLFSECGTGIYASKPTEFEVGRLWSADSAYGIAEGVLNDADDLYGSVSPLKYQHFVNTGDDTGVNH
jgi:hypothetical protein